MAAASDKARFHLEQQVPELQEFERKKIFSRDEIAAITSKRSDFEHALNARGSQPGDYARYASYEMNVDSLRRKRCKRRGVKGLMYNGPRTVFSILERATRHFPGDKRLWMQYIEYCRKEEANKKLAQAFTSILRLHPRDWSLWVLAAKHYAEQQGDMGTARSYMQRGLRFCNDEPKLYLEYVKLEMVYLAKLAARRKVLGLDETRSEKPDDDENMITLPTITAEDINPDINKGTEEVNTDALERLAAAPALSGAIPLAIFNAAMKQFQNSPTVAGEFFDLVASFTAVPSTSRILLHILGSMRATEASSIETLVCEAKFQLFAVELDSTDFPSALGQALVTLRTALGTIQDERRSMFAEKAVGLLLPYYRASNNGEDDDIHTVLETSIRRYAPFLAAQQDFQGSIDRHDIEGILESPHA